jgi:hypothetical protein
VDDVCFHLVEVLLLSSLVFCPFDVKLGTNLGQGFLRILGLFLLYGECLLPPCQLLLPHKKLLL